MDVRRVVVEGVDVNQYALYDEYRAHVASTFYCLSATRLVQAEDNGACSNCRGAAESRTLLGAKVQNLFDKYNSLLIPFIYY